MELCGRNIPDACYTGCPETNFPALAEAIAAHEGDNEKARAARLSEAAITAVANLDNEYETQLDNALRGIPPKNPGPWRPDLSGLKQAEQDAVGRTACCKRSGVILVNLSGGEDIHVRRSK